ncbi:mitochondrial protein Pet127-domain-containing protein [Aspergillus avenaceus]|uniref:Mitochondrial protein Pet127-domain-containing protein n=1 Tax=Aspergillus avenaceus TaxID=36643 RepID=A0A5N6TGZ4_ASPAV|nr:mitochondrial protein Pet127-domain-containing protein [Aspergillus avenaceus]
MLRASLRSVSDPFRDNVCLSCLVQRLGARRTGLRLYSNTALRPSPQHDNNDDVASRAITEGFSALGKTPPQKGTKTRHPGSHPKQRSKSPHKREKLADIPDNDEAAGAPTQLNKGKPSAAASKGADDKGNTKPGQRSPRPTKPNSGPPNRAKTQKPKKQPQVGNPDAKPQDSTSRIQSSLKTIVSQLAPTKNKPAPNDEGPNSLSFITNSISKKESGKVVSNQFHFKHVETAPVPRLSFGLERVLFNPGVYHLRDPRSRVFNFDPYLGSIMPVTEFDFDALKEYITSSKDHTLRNIAVKEKKKYIGSSSSMTSVLSHFHYLLSAWRGIDIRTLSQGFPDKLRTFTRLLRAPSAMFLRYQDGTYAIDADKEFDSANILMNLGKSMEKLLTLPKEDFERYRRSSEDKITAEEEQAIPESYHYSTLGDFLMRSQLDAYDPRLPGTGMFDLKTRAVVSIRMDARNFEHGLGYEIKGRYGAYESYEREFYDMIRAAFLKYSLQVRIGRMDGIFVAFHNIERIFGFQYVSLPEMDQTLHGQHDTTLGDTEFQLSLGLWNKILDKVTAKYPKRSIRLHFETRDAQTPFMYIFAEPVTDEEIHAIQTKNQAEIDAYQRRILNLSPGHDNLPPSDEQTEVQPPLSGKQEPAAERTPPASPTEPAVNYDSAAPVDEAFLSELENENAGSKTEGRELLAMTLLVKNYVNGKLVDRPSDLKKSDTWSIDYELSEMEGKQAHALYQACQKRREKALSGRGEDETDVAGNVYIRRLREISQAGRHFRMGEEERDKKEGTVVLDESIQN